MNEQELKTEIQSGVDAAASMSSSDISRSVDNTNNLLMTSDGQYLPETAVRGVSETAVDLYRGAPEATDVLYKMAAINSPVDVFAQFPMITQLIGFMVMIALVGAGIWLFKKFGATALKIYALFTAMSYVGITQADTVLGGVGQATETVGSLIRLITG